MVYLWKVSKDPVATHQIVKQSKMEEKNNYQPSITIREFLHSKCKSASS